MRKYKSDFKCGTFKTDRENGITPEIRARMDADRLKARGESKVEFGWVIEHKDSEPSTPRYFDGIGWSDPGDNASALRYARNVDALKIAALLDPPIIHRIAEHGWES